MIKIFGGTHAGLAHVSNQDAILCNAQNRLAVVADGIGGRPGGDVASRIVVDTFDTLFRPGVNLKDIAENANRRILECVRMKPHLRKMGSTVVAAFAGSVGFDVVWAGDSRAYLWQRAAGLRQVTRDHSLGGHGGHVITQVLGRDNVTIGQISETWSGGDILLLCSDGLYQDMEKAEIEFVLKSHENIEESVSTLIQKALENGGRDNISIILVEKKY